MMIQRSGTNGISLDGLNWYFFIQVIKCLFYCWFISQFKNVEQYAEFQDSLTIIMTF